MTVIWDLETAAEKSEDEDWNHYKLRAGVSLSCIYEPETGIYQFHDQHDLGDLARALEVAGEVVSYNGVGFDHVVLDAAIGRHVFIANEVDLWEIIKARLERKWPKGSWTLGATCRRTIGQDKAGHGATAPIMAAQGRWGPLATYLVKDVWLTWRLWEFIRHYGYVVDPDGIKMELGVPING